MEGRSKNTVVISRYLYEPGLSVYAGYDRYLMNFTLLLRKKLEKDSSVRYVMESERD